MTRRLTIVLDESVTETECGECRFRRPHPVSVRADICTNDGLIKSFPRPLIPYGERTLECLEAERAAAASVEKSFEPSESDVRAAAAEAGVTEAERDAALAEVARLREAMPSDDEMPFVRAAIVRYMRSVRRIPDGAPEREMGMRSDRWLRRIEKARGG